MNLNPFSYEYKTYPSCPLSTALSGILGGIQRIFIIFAVIITLTVLFDDIENWYEALACALVMFIAYFVIRRYKYQLCDKLADKEIQKNS